MAIEAGSSYFTAQSVCSSPSLQRHVHKMSAGAAVEELYKNYGILADAKDEVSEHSDAYDGIIKASKGSLSEKKLASGFITKFFRYFPTLHDSAIDALLDLIEDEDPQIRHGAIKSLPDICKGASDKALCTKVADVLTQLLPTEDPTDLGLVKTGMVSVLQVDTQHALSGIFGQIMGEDEGVREKGIGYVCNSLPSMRHKLFIPHPENEKFLLELIRKVLVDVTGEEFESFMDLASKLQYISTPEGGQEMAKLVSDQAELGSEFKPTDSEFIDRFMTCFRQALKFCKRGSTASPFIEYICVKILPSLKLVSVEETRQELLQLLAEGCLYQLDSELAQKCTENIFTFLLEYMPLPPSEGAEEPKLHFSVVECVLFAFHQLVKDNKEFLTGEDNADKLKDFRQRLQYFARGSQTYHAQLAVALKGKSALELKDEQSKLRSVALKMTANISSLIRDFFHNPPTYSATVQLSWGAKKPDNVPEGRLQRKRTSSEGEGVTPAKRKHSPIRFDSSNATGQQNVGKRDTIQYYTPPKDQFSKGISNVGNFETYRGRGRSGGRRGRGRGQGQRRGRGW